MWCGLGRGSWRIGWCRGRSDPYPYTFLTLLTSLEAIFLTSFVLISQSHLEQLSHRRAALDLQVNLLAEAEMTKILFAVGRICDHLGIDAVRNDPEAQAMEAATDVTALSEALDDEAQRYVSACCESDG